ncbi:uncharacterized protein [Zea mays]|uniref:Uncharacterized protein n=1 Tax=Zea mays TaxID=4577 RepID=B6TTJ1_MAIZE|nr:uncharacterized protein LOC100277372 [Zea mays]XP_035818894.1 uncharacterized protein LOC100277372 isoform X1 [Zea mays]ACG40424.1 hypothetical protein [Zea mays]|eukprot:NP_001144425.1 uncharacterized protein LOC100277372 [Zea mays]
MVSLFGFTSKNICHLGLLIRVQFYIKHASFTCFPVLDFRSLKPITYTFPTTTFILLSCSQRLGHCRRARSPRQLLLLTRVQDAQQTSQSSCRQGDEVRDGDNFPLHNRILQQHMDPLKRRVTMPPKSSNKQAQSLR